MTEQKPPLKLLTGLQTMCRKTKIINYCKRIIDMNDNNQSRIVLRCFILAVVISVNTVSFTICIFYTSFKILSAS